jgi:Protein of unknown function (DUF2853)
LRHRKPLGGILSGKPSDFLVNPSQSTGDKAKSTDKQFAWEQSRFLLGIRAFRVYRTGGYTMDHLADVKKYTAKPDEAAVAGMAKNYALVMSKADTKWVAASDPNEIQTVVDNFLKKKLGRKEKDDALTAACAAVAAKMKDARNKSRIVFYYLLAEHYGALKMFHPKKK